jgi:hypothetical protein
MTRPYIPDEPEVPAEQCAEAELGVRYEDVCQDGRLRIDGVWPPMGRILWNEARLGHVFARLAAAGVHNVLARVVIHAENVPISPRLRLRNRVRYQLGHTLDEQGQVNRIVLNTWLRSEGIPARKGPERVEPGAMHTLVAQAHGQHVFIRRGAPAGQHRVLELEGPGLPAVPKECVELPSADDLLQPPPGGRFIEDAPAAEPAPVVFGLSHTDLNQHVNFLTYPRCVEDAALRRFGELGHGRPLLGRSVELSYLKPCFAGDRMRVVARAFAAGDVLGVCAVFVRDARFEEARSWQQFGRAYCVARLWLS